MVGEDKEIKIILFNEDGEELVKGYLWGVKWSMYWDILIKVYWLWVLFLIYVDFDF